MVEKERRRGRDEVREYWIMPAPAAFAERPEWRTVKSVGLVVRRRLTADGRDDAEADVRYFLDSRRPLVRPFAHAVRSHWGIENRLHWHLDVTFAEDANRTRRGSGAETAGMLRRVALSLLHQDTCFSGSLKAKRKRAGWSEAALAQIFFGKPS